MCTATWLHRPERYLLFFNRDESLQRSDALPPRLIGDAPLARLAPVDPDGGGSWLAVNAEGLTTAVLNYYEASRTPDRTARDRALVRPSRGVLLLELATCTTAVELAERFRQLDLAPYAPFHLLAIDRRSPPILWTWDGRNRSAEANPEMPVTTSSHRPEETIPFRKRHAPALENLPDDHARRDALETYHHWHDPAHPTLTPVIERTDARTVSLSRIEVGPNAAVFTYWPRCRAQSAAFGEPRTVRLALT